MSNGYPALNHLGRAYLHQDFAIVSASADGAVHEFFHDEPEMAAEIPAEVERALAAYPNEEAARRFVQDQLDSAYLVEADGLTYRGWLQSIADRAQDLGY